MEVTRHNFKESLPLIQSSIEKADFLVIDAEFTGLSKGRDVSLFDTPAEYYTNILNSSSEFLLTQYGLCAFYWDADKEEYINEAYNFYIFPRGNYALEKIFLCQSSSLDFLAAQGFDFNKWIKDGISYATEPVEQFMRNKIKEKQTSDNERQYIPIPEENKQQVEEICKKVKQFILDDEQEEMTIDRCNPFIRRLLFQELGLRFKDEVMVDAKVLENKERVIVVTRIKSADDTNTKRMLKEQKEWDDLEEAIGFSKVARMISQSGKLVVGHNMLLDVLHTLSHFFQDLPSDYNTFKEFAHCMFPCILDTKYMSSMPPFKDKVNSNVLQHLYQSLSEEPFSLPKIVSEPGRGYSGADDKQHEAGYDAFVTGACLLGLRARLRGAGRARRGDALLAPYANKLYLARTARQDSPYINLEGDDPAPSREHVFHMTFPKEWQRNDINQLFSPFGQIIVQFLDDTSAYVALTNRKRSREMLKALSGHEKVTLVPFSIHKNLQNKTADHARPLTAKKTVVILAAVVGSSDNGAWIAATPRPRVRASAILHFNAPAHLHTADKRNSNSSVRHDSTEEKKTGSCQASPVMPTPVPRPVNNFTVKLNEPVENSTNKSRTRPTSTPISKEKEKHKLADSPLEVEETQPVTKKTRLRTNSASNDKEKWKIEEISQDNKKVVKVEESGWSKQTKAQAQAEAVFAGAPRTVAVFKESDSWL